MKSFYTVILLFAFCGVSFACNGFKARFNTIANCGKYESVIKVNPNVNATIDNQCNIVANGCVNVRKDFSDGKARVVIKLNGLELQRIDRDICDGLLNSNSPQLRNIIQLFGLPNSCPIRTGELCATDEHKINLEQYKDFLALATGKVEILIKMLHGDAGKSCIRVAFDIYR